MANADEQAQWWCTPRCQHLWIGAGQLLRQMEPGGWSGWPYPSGGWTLGWGSGGYWGRFAAALVPSHLHAYLKYMYACWTYQVSSAAAHVHDVTKQR